MNIKKLTHLAWVLLAGLMAVGGGSTATAATATGADARLQSSYALLAAPVEQAKLTANDAASFDRFGERVAISGDTVAIGAMEDDDAGNSSGSAYVFVRSGTSWSQQAKLTAGDAAANDFFGISVSNSGDTIVVGALTDEQGTDSGSVYVFVRSGTSWSQQAKLTANDAAVTDQFGRSVAISGDTIVVGAYWDDDGGTNSGSAYIFQRSGTSWSQQAKLTASDAVADSWFGFSVAIDQDSVVVGALTDEQGTDSGSAYIFQRSGTSWSQQAKLTASDATAGDRFGEHVSIAGSTVVTGAIFDDDGGTNSGSAYIFQRSGTSWSQQAKLTASDATADDRFGLSTSISGDTVVVGALLDDDGGTNSGSAYIFQRSGTSWSQQAKLTASDAAAGDQFGASVSISGDTTVVGAVLDNIGGGIQSGSAYVFVPENLAPELDPIGNQVVDEGATLIVSVSANDTDSDPVTLSASGLPSFATFTDNGDGTGSLVLAPGFEDAGVYPDVEITASDGSLSDGETFTVTVNDVNQPPVAINDAYGVVEDDTLTVDAASGVLANDSDPDGVATGAGTFAVVTNQFTGPGKATIFDLAAEPPVKTAEVSVGGQPFDVVITPDGTKALVTNVDDDTVSVIDLTAVPPAVSTTVSVGDLPLGVAIDPDGDLAIVANVTDKTISILDLTSDPPLVADTIPVGSGLSGGPRDVSITADGRYAIVTFDHSGPFGVVLAVDLTLVPPAEVISARVEVGKSPLGLGVDPARTVAAVASTGPENVTVLDITTFPFSVLGSVNVGNNPGAKPDISQSGLTVVPNADDDTVSIIDVASATPTVVATLPVGDGPRGAAIIDQDNVALIANRTSGSISRLNLSDFTFLSPLSGVPSANHIAIHEETGDILTAVLDSPTSNGSLTLSSDGSFDYIPNPNFCGQDSFTYHVNDGTDDSNIAAVTINVGCANDPPIAVDDSYSINKNTSLNVTVPGVLNNDSDVDSVTLAAVLDSQTSSGNLTLNSDGSFDYTPDPNFCGQDSFSYHVNDGTDDSNIVNVIIDVVCINDPPVVGADQLAVTVDEGQTATNSGTVSDIDSASVTLSASVGTVIDNGNGTWSWSSGTDDGPAESQTIIITADDGTDTGQVTFGLMVDNVAPTATFANDGPVDEGSSFTLSLTNPSDPSGADTTAGFEYAFDCGDGAGLGAFSSSNSTTCSTDDNGTRFVKGQIRDKDGGVTEYTENATVNNVAPSIDSITAPVDPVDINDQPVNVIVEFSDPGTADTHDVSWDWDDSNTDLQMGAASPASQDHTYAQPGVYAITVTVTDDDGGSATVVNQFIVIYDPDGGFVTGGGWIYSEAGWCQLDPVCAGAEGKANFGFVSKYKKGKSVPEGNTEFNFSAGGLNFHSDSYDWLVINQGGTNAQYKGSGTINGDPGPGDGYKFMIWAKDLDPGDNDTFRIKIWYEDGGEIIVYDNGFDQAIGGGNIKIHNK